MTNKALNELENTNADLNRNVTIDDLNAGMEIIHHTNNGYETRTIDHIDDIGGFVLHEVHLDNGDYVVPANFHDGGDFDINTKLYLTK